MNEIERPVMTGGAMLFASADTWIEGEAVRQLGETAARPGVTAAAGMPDLHPGRYGPVGCAVEAEGTVHPDLIGTDVGCGMAMFRLSVPARRIRTDRAAAKLAALDADWRDEALGAGAGAGLATGHEGALGTLGGGNHFCELQAVVSVDDGRAAAGLEKGDAVLLVHTGSRSLGAAVFASFWNGSRAGMPLEGAGREWLAACAVAMEFASLNRKLVAARAAGALGLEAELLFDVPHNFAEETGNGRILHRKGAAPADRGTVPVPGSRGSETFLMVPDKGAVVSLFSMAHGAGRKHDRSWMKARARGGVESRRRTVANAAGGRLVCADRRLEVEEAPMAYKDVATVVADLERFAIARTAAVTRPLVTFKSSEGAKGR